MSHLQYQTELLTFEVCIFIIIKTVFVSNLSFMLSGTLVTLFPICNFVNKMLKTRRFNFVSEQTYL